MTAQGLPFPWTCPSCLQGVVCRRCRRTKTRTTRHHRGPFYGYGHWCCWWWGKMLQTRKEMRGGLYDIVVNERASTTARFRECEHPPMLGRKKLGDRIWSEVHSLSPLVITKRPKQISLKEDPVGMYPELRMNRPGHKICSFFHIPHGSSYWISIPFPSSNSACVVPFCHSMFVRPKFLPGKSRRYWFREHFAGETLVWVMD